ncbi:Uncharacterized protein DBV15_07585 [Temnothorax longispinosus]|uniref:Uncharacterized protein n=1 Tax=Temnothorax longispinosus TaxID=300112 RepID=A0A4S2L511_9HYME|nr:Uncharacterized protein DBV15_07585 [Temnothorax longispinosus]
MTRVTESSATRKYFTGDQDRSDVDVGLSRMQMLARAEFVRGYWQTTNKDRTGLHIPDVARRHSSGKRFVTLRRTKAERVVEMKRVHNNKPAAAAAGKEQKENPEEDRRGDEFLMREPSEGWRGE